MAISSVAGGPSLARSSRTVALACTSANAQQRFRNGFVRQPHAKAVARLQNEVPFDPNAPNPLRLSQALAATRTTSAATQAIRTGAPAGPDGGARRFSGAAGRGRHGSAAACAAPRPPRLDSSGDLVYRLSTSAARRPSRRLPRCCSCCRRRRGRRRRRSRRAARQPSFQG
jgi:hypothetical protein